MTFFTFADNDLFIPNCRILGLLWNCTDNDNFQLPHNEGTWINTDSNQNMASEKQSPHQLHVSDTAFVKYCINRKATFFWEVKRM